MLQKSSSSAAARSWRVPPQGLPGRQLTALSSSLPAADLRDYAFGVNAVGGVPEVVGKSGPILGTAYYQGTPAIWKCREWEPASLPIFPRAPSRR